MTRGRLLSLAVAVAVLAVGATAAARTARVSVVKASTGIGVDGGRLVAWAENRGAGSDGQRPGRVVVLDDRTGSKSTVDLGRPCDYTQVLDGSERRFLAQCSTSERTDEVVLDLRGPTVTPV